MIIFYFKSGGPYSIWQAPFSYSASIPDVRDSRTSIQSIRTAASEYAHDRERRRCTGHRVGDCSGAVPRSLRRRSAALSRAPASAWKNKVPMGFSLAAPKTERSFRLCEQRTASVAQRGAPGHVLADANTASRCFINLAGATSRHARSATSINTSRETFSMRIRIIG
jgi:hypothetical protein